ncbi:MAG: EAL domain-containing protein [Magnetococcales bacterium]|nr:EAL domain-containing protein [Magnetococcales bacterium]
MDDDPSKKNEIFQKLLAIRTEWAAKLPEKLQQMQTLWQNLQKGAWQPEQLRELHRLVHSLAGSGGTFGFPQIGLEARKVEILLKNFLEEEDPPGKSEQNKISAELDRLSQLSQKALDKGVPPPPVPTLEKKPERSRQKSGELIYLVEDDAVLAEELKLQLALYGYSVHWFDTLATFQIAFQEQEPDAVIMDIILPDGLGTEALQKIRQTRGDTPLNTLFITVHDDIHHRLEALRAGGNRFINKPFNLPQIVEGLEAINQEKEEDPYRILIIDDSVSFAGHCALLLRQASMETMVITDPLQAFKALVDFLPDLILMDLYMPQCSGQELAQIIRQRETFVSLPIVFLSAETDPQSQLRAMNLGGDDFLNKGIEPEQLVVAIQHRAKRSRQIRAHLTRDELTGLPNRNALKESLRQAVRQSQRAGSKMGLAMIDMDLFKNINDSLGHIFGDKVLMEIAQRIKGCLRPGDIACRLGGDEFAAIFLEVAESADVGHAANRIEKALSQPIHLDGQTIHLTASLGITIHPDDSEDLDILITNADLALNSAKASGRNAHHFFMTDMGTQAKRRHTLEGELREGLQRGDFILHYQPKVDLPDRRVVGMESLVRWIHPEKGMISPGEFIPIAEETGLIIPLGDWILRKACADTREWLDQGHDLRVAVNLSSRQFQQANFIEQVESALEESGLPAKNLELEITESMVMGDMDKVIGLLQQFRERDIHISVDDFGTGYSSLSYLKRFPIHALKIDQSFIRNMHEDEDDSSIVKAIISMGHSLRLNIVAEGVEENEHLEMLEKLGCEFIQGYYLSKPLPKEAFSQFLRERNLD